LRIKDKGWIKRQTASIAAGSAASARRGPPRRLRKHQSTTSGGMAAGIAIGPRYGDRCARASRAAADIVTKPDRGTMTTAAAVAGQGALPFTAAISTMTNSSVHSAMI